MWPPLASPSFKYVGRTIQPDDLAILDWCGLTPLFSGEAEGKSLSENLDMRWRLARRSPPTMRSNGLFPAREGERPREPGFRIVSTSNRLTRRPALFRSSYYFASVKPVRPKARSSRALQNVRQDWPTYCGLKAQPIVAYGNAIGMSGKRNSRAESPIHNSSGLQPSKNFRPRFLGRCPRLLWFAPLALDGFNGEIRTCVFAGTRFFACLMILPDFVSSYHFILYRHKAFNISSHHLFVSSYHYCPV